MERELLTRIVGILRSDSPTLSLALASRPDLVAAITEAEQLLGIEKTTPGRKVAKRRKA